MAETVNTKQSFYGQKEILKYSKIVKHCDEITTPSEQNCI